MDQKHGSLCRNDDEIVDEDFAIALHRRRTSVFAKIILKTRMIHLELMAINYDPYILPAAFAVFYFLRRIHIFLLRTTWTTKDMMLAGHILDDIARIFEPIIWTDISQSRVDLVLSS